MIVSVKNTSVRRRSLAIHRYGRKRIRLTPGTQNIDASHWAVDVLK
jgi:hypothetical protein